MAKRKEKPVELADGRWGMRRYRTDYWFDRRHNNPSTYSRGFPRTEDGSIEGAGRVIMKGWCSQIGCFDRVTGRYKWMLQRGERVPGTNLYGVVIVAGKDIS